MRDRDLPTSCLNCATPLSVDPAFCFCPSCGQENQPRVLPFRTVVREACAEFVQIDGKLARTFWALLFRPGYLTQAFLAGQRIAFLSPLKMYLFTSATFFLITSLVFPITGSDIENYLQRASMKGSKRSDAARVTVNGMPAVADKTKWVSVPAFSLSGQTIDIEKLPTSVVEYRDLQETLGEKGQSTDPLIVQTVKRKLIRLRESPGDAILGISVGVLSNMTLFAVPLLALFMLPMYLRRDRRLYTEHFVFQLHCHTFSFVVLTLVVILDSAVPATGNAAAALLLLWLPVYGMLALRRVYGQSWGKSLLKAFLMLNAYGTILAFAAMLGVLVTLISILITL